MSPSTNASQCSEVGDEEDDPRLAPTIEAVNWDGLSAVALEIYHAKSASWAQQFNGGYNVVRILQLQFDDGTKAEVVARVPYQPVEGMANDRAESLCRRIASEVASMQYVATHTRIPVPGIIAHSTEKDGGGIGSPYILMTKAEGEPLSVSWHDMEDGKREVILRQVVEILLQLSSLRFDRIGALFKGNGSSQLEWYIAPTSSVLDVDDASILHQSLAKTHTSALDYWIAISNANLERIHKQQFGYVNKSYDYVMAWFLQSLVPSLYDTELDAKGFPLLPGDFHSQNIMVVDTDTASPRITSLIDWEFTATDPTSSFAQYPLFIVDHPFWDDDHPIKPRNVKDQATFNRLMREAESQLDPEGNLPLSRAFENCYPTYLFQQCMRDPSMFNVLYQPLFDHVFGAQDEDEENFSVNYYQALMSGVLKKSTEQYEKETEVKKEAANVLGDELITFELTRSEFRAIVLEHLDKFKPEGEVKEWLSTYGKE